LTGPRPRPLVSLTLSGYKALPENHPKNPIQADQTLASQLCGAVQAIHSRGWAPGTGGNFSVTLSTDPLRLLITPSGVDKGCVEPQDLLEVDDSGAIVRGSGKPSAETLLHTTIVQRTSAGSVLHTHTPWSTILSLRHRETGFVTIEGLEMLKGLSGIPTHEHTKRVPILANSQDMRELSVEVGRLFDSQTDFHGFLLAGHGLYTWGVDLAEARRHLEVFEFLFEVTARMELSSSPAASLF